MRATTESKFISLYGASPKILFESYGRVNLIGEHTDYHDGLALPLPIARTACIALCPDDRASVTLRSTLLNVTVTITNERSNGSARCVPSTTYFEKIVEGAIQSLMEIGIVVPGCHGLVHSNIPAGAGLSSSAALAVCVVGGLAQCSGTLLPWDDLAALAWRAETVAGASCGQLDHISASYKRNSADALLIDFRSSEVIPVCIPKGISFIALDSGERRDMAFGAVGKIFRSRKEEGQRACVALGVASLRDACEEHLFHIDPLLAQRAKHVIRENERVKLAVQCLRSGELAKFGACLTESHLSLRDDYGVSSLALDATVAVACSSSDCFGARLTGGGFGGFVIAAVKTDGMKRFLEKLARAYIPTFVVHP